VKLTEEQTEVLKNPHSNLNLLTEELFRRCGFEGNMYVYEDCVVFDIHNICGIYINLEEYEINEYGFFEIYGLHTNGKEIHFIENYFEFPLLPTKEEKEMFFIEFGFEYPIREY